MAKYTVVPQEPEPSPASKATVKRTVNQVEEVSVQKVLVQISDCERNMRNQNTTRDGLIDQLAQIQVDCTPDLDALEVPVKLTIAEVAP